MLARWLPMVFTRHAFYDSVTGEEVSEYMQLDGTLVLATSCWSWFRVPTNDWLA